MWFRVYARLGHFPNHFYPRDLRARKPINGFGRRTVTSRASFQTGSEPEGNSFLIPGATVATIVMLGLLHARRLYDDKKMEEAREKGVDLEFSPDVKAAFLRLLPLRTISRLWGLLTSTEIPIPFRSLVYKSWARAFHTNLEEVGLPLEEYASLQEFFIHSLKEGSRPIDPDPNCLVSPVDGIILRFGELQEPGDMIEQVKGFSYSASSLLGTNLSFPLLAADDEYGKHNTAENRQSASPEKNSWWRISLASPRVRGPDVLSPVKGIFYCVIYLKPGYYHRVHSPVDWNVLLRRHFSGNLFPLNERATRTIRNLHVENERVVLEGQWLEGFMALVAIGATNVGSVKLFIEPELKTNRPRKLLHTEPPTDRFYEPKGTGLLLKKGDEVAAFRMGSTVVLIFQAARSRSEDGGASSEFRFCINRGERIRVGQAIGRLHGSS
ncbi:phosphatidylserine decarboxylase proenzyme 1, mitochondrial isoform X1 [Nymphaea colorata]|nr:phosphatidylserine decarboxylase proenzyme 1, mitochondrial isoform X1 [Nymphaea colorata]